MAADHTAEVSRIVSCRPMGTSPESLNMKFLAVSAIFAVVSVVVGLIFFYKKQDEFILHI